MRERLARARERWPLLDHAVRMVKHYGDVRGNLEAGAVTYFAFLSVFPILLLAFFVIGYVSKVYPGAQDDLMKAINGILPGLVGDGENQLSLDAVEENAGAVGLIGLAGVLYAGLGWLSGMRDALQVMFVVPAGKKPNFVVGKLRDLVSLTVIGSVLLVSVAVAGVITGASEQILELFGLGEELEPSLALLTVVVGIGANMVLFFALFKLLAAPPLPTRALWAGALLGALGFEVLKQLSVFLLQSTQERPAFQAFGIALILLVWINYFSRVVMFAAAWAYTTVPAAEPESAASEMAGADGRDEQADAAPVGAGRKSRGERDRGWAAPFAGGAAAMLGIVALARRKKRD